MTIVDFIEDNKITDREAIKAALCMPSSVPDSFALKPLYPIGVGQWKTDKMPPQWTNNDQFTLGTVYPIYHSDGQRFVIGKDGKGRKFNVQDWKELVWF